jgi:hypothetical protein
MLCCRDNNESQTKRADATIQKMLADKLCKVPRSQVRTIRIVPKSSMFNTETWVSSWLVAGGPACVPACTQYMHLPMHENSTCSRLFRAGAAVPQGRTSASHGPPGQDQCKP